MKAKATSNVRLDARKAGRGLPSDTVVMPLERFSDARGTVAEFYRSSWPTGIAPVQWVMTVTHAGVLRGMHVHVVHDDYLCVLQGRICVGLRDLRSESPTEGMALCTELRADDLSTLFIPHGVAHGFYAHQPSVYVLGTSHYYDPADELGCHWTDPGLGFRWPCDAPVVSSRDDELGRLDDLLPRIGPYRAM